jgi:hypothetical protein
MNLRSIATRCRTSGQAERWHEHSSGESPLPRQQASLRSWELFADCVVVGIEQILVAVVGGAGFRLAIENKRLEEPCRVGQVPARRAGVGHRLNEAIFGFERFAQHLAELANLLVSLCQMADRGTDCRGIFWDSREGSHVGWGLIRFEADRAARSNRSHRSSGNAEQIPRAAPSAQNHRR